ncbi:MAG: hypothetical protein JSR33_08415 [Proteobacteria bacterium]|nr:hypothetical protein [Pseudomonadota bacterium]
MTKSPLVKLNFTNETTLQQAQTELKNYVLGQEKKARDSFIDSLNYLKTADTQFTLDSAPSLRFS